METRGRYSDQRRSKHMKYHQLGKTGFTVSAVAYGGIVSASQYGETTFPGDGQRASDSYVALAIEQGINYFDVAPTYGNAQMMLGNSLKHYRRNIHLACKTEARTRAQAEKLMHESLNLLHTDYFDVYQMHLKKWRILRLLSDPAV